jgi:hypothetical protein
MAAPYPPSDPAREQRIVDDVCDLLHDRGAATQTKIKRWLTHTLAKSKLNRHWWFLDRLARAALGYGQDIVDLAGPLDRVAAVYAPMRLHQIKLGQMTDLRQYAAANGKPNGGIPTHYALEAGRRVHLWPCPDRCLAFASLYARPMTVDCVPDDWETILLDGVLGLYGRHFDRDALAQEPAEFERRFWAALRTAAVDSYDVSAFKAYADELPAQASVTANSATDTAVSFVTNLSAIIPQAVSYHRSTTGEHFPEDAPMAYTYNGDGTLHTITATWELATYVQTLSYAGGKLTDISGWMKQ